MITNDRQYKILKIQVEKFQDSLTELDILSDKSNPAIIQLQRNAIESKLQELINQVKEYEELKAGSIVFTEVSSLSELPLVLIKSRIANGLTQAELANTLGMKEQQIQRLEAEKYESTSLKTLLKIASELKIRISADVQIKEIDTKGQYDLNNYPFKQMFLRNWFSKFTGSLNDAAKKSSDLLADFFVLAGKENLETVLARRTIRSDKSFNDFAINAWCAKVIIEARKQELDVFFNKSAITNSWLHELAHLSVNSNGPKLAFEKLNQIGIRTVIEAQLEGTYLDGAALLIDQLYPVIGMTLRYDRLDNFWFVLFHEIAHVYLHLNSEHTEIIDDLDSVDEGIEKEADEFALNALISNETWRKSLARFSPTNTTIINEAKKLNVHPALVAGRIRKETKKYFEFTDLIGQGEVRKLFTNSNEN
ncbi:MAG TPA: helix-turn-helix domain-containing protein [Puia sp.]|jgi:HTH-type transcriptional regulator/antitoxin HigA|nr:helix-turn-helix domain-containing protein [Puia sp.]